MSKQKQLTENDVIKAVVLYLKEEGWKICKVCGPTEKGIDIEAIRNGKRLAVEAKGGTSSKNFTKRFGKGFSNKQKGSHIAVALLATLKEISKNRHYVAMAFPDDEGHLCILEKIRPALKILRVKIYMVDLKKKVRVLNANRSWF